MKARPLLRRGRAAVVCAVLLAGSIPVAGLQVNSRAAGRRIVPGCADSIRDQSGGPCLEASSVPTPGLLFPAPHDGGMFNQSTGNYNFVGGGVSNQTTHYGSTIGGGSQNDAMRFGASVAGGYMNGATAGGTAVGGGYDNDATAGYASVAGGFLNLAYGGRSTVGGGSINWAVGSWATVSGGRLNAASGSDSFAAGHRAKADHAGSFVWGDSQNVNKTSSLVDEFNVYASGGTRIFSNATATSGVLLAPGAGMWSSVCDREAKQDLEQVDGHAVLERLAALPIWTWRYRTQPGSVRHMGPTAQDFHAAFGLGAGETTIDELDPAGVALAAIQGLEVEVSALRAENRELRARIERLGRARATALAPDQQGGGR